MFNKKLKLKETKSPKIRENDGFSSSDGEFEKELAKIDSYERRITLLRNQIRGMRKEHINEIAEKDEEIEKLKNIMMKQKIDLFRIEESIDSLEFEKQLKENDQQLEQKDKELQEMRQNLQERNHQLQLKNREVRTVNNQLHYIEQQLREKDQELQGKDEKLQNQNKTIQELDNRLQEKLAENDKLTSEINRLSDEATDFDVNNQTQMASQMAYGNLERNSTSFFNDKHVVPQHLDSERHDYAKHFRFWKFDDGPFEYTVSNFNDGNFQNAFKLMGMIGQRRVTQIFRNGSFSDPNGPTNNINTLILSHEKRLAIDFQRKQFTNTMTMRVRRMSPTEIRQNRYGQNNHFHGPS